MPTPGDQQHEFDDITARLHDERGRLSRLELDGLKNRVMARAPRGRSRLLRWTGSVRWAAPAIGLAIAALATGGTLAAVGGSRNAGLAASKQNAACDQYASHIKFRFHYNADGSTGSFGAATDWSPSSGISGCSGTVSIGPQSSEGNLQLTPGTTVNLGYDFQVPGNNSSFTLTVNSASWTLYWSCPKGGTPHPSSTTVTQTDPPYNASYTFSDSNWQPVSNQKGSNSPYQDSTTVPAVCGAGNPVSLKTGVLFTAQVTAS
jgi:hypothetical protein